jgi:hypothetical protein
MTIAHPGRDNLTLVIYTRVAFLPAFTVFSAVFLGVPLALGRV